MTGHLHQAISAGDFEAARRLLAGGADPNATDGEGRTPLMLAAASARSTFKRGTPSPRLLPRCESLVLMDNDVILKACCYDVVDELLK